jgi:hypothetical protein
MWTIMTIFVKTLLTVVALGLQFSCYGQELATFTGTIEYKFHLSATHMLTDDQKKEFETDIDFYAQRRGLLTDYFTKLNSGDSEGAKRILKKDRKIKDTDNFALTYMFALLKMRDLGILYKPCIQVNDERAEGILISCTAEQFEEMTNNKREYTLECRYVGELIFDKTKAYELVTTR